jgi:hypothetical protein
MPPKPNFKAMEPAAIRQWLADAEFETFGCNLQRDPGSGVLFANNGIGSPGHKTENHFAAVRRREGPEAEKLEREAEYRSRQPR